MVKLFNMDLYRMVKARSFKVCLILAFVLALAYMPALKLLAYLAKTVSTEPSAAGLIPESVTLSSLISNPLARFSGLLALISVTGFFYADMENGYIKNIAGQMPKRGFSILSRFLAAAVHNVIFTVVSLIGCLIGAFLCQKVTADSGIASAVLTFFLRIILLQALSSILLLVTSGLRSKPFGMALAVLFGLGALELLYSGIDSGLNLLIKGLQIRPYMPDALLGMENPGTLRALLSSAVTIAIFLPAAIRVFDKRDIK